MQNRYLVVKEETRGHRLDAQAPFGCQNKTTKRRNSKRRWRRFNNRRCPINMQPLFMIIFVTVLVAVQVLSTYAIEAATTTTSTTTTAPQTPEKPSETLSGGTTITISTISTIEAPTTTATTSSSSTTTTTTAATSGDDEPPEFRHQTTTISTKLPDFDRPREGANELQAENEDPVVADRRHVSSSVRFEKSTDKNAGSNSQGPLEATITPSSFSVNDDDDDDDDHNETDEAKFAFTTVQQHIEADTTSPEPPPLHHVSLASSSEQPTPINRLENDAATTTIRPAVDEKSSLINDNLIDDERGAVRGRYSTSSDDSLAVNESGDESQPAVATASVVPNNVASTNAATQLVRSRKSPENDTMIASNKSSSSPKNSTSQPVNNSQTPSSLFDYDDFDLDYQLKLSPDTGQTGGGQTAGSGSPQQQPGLFKRDHDNHLGAGSWPAQLGQQPSHLFNSTMTGSSNSNIAPGHGSESTSTQPTPAQASSPLLFHGTPPIMPSLLTLKSTQLTSQELNKARPHFLFYPEQYSEFSGPNAYHASLEALANGDLLATASNPELHLQQQQQHKQLSGTAINQQATAATNNSATMSGSPLAGAGNSSSSMISLLNGSPIVNKGRDNLASFAHHPSSSVLQSTGGIRLMASRPRPGQAQLPTTTTEDDTTMSSSVTTIVVDNSTPTTESPAAPAHGPSTTDQPHSALYGTTSTQSPQSSTTTTTTNSPMVRSSPLSQIETTASRLVGPTAGINSTTATSQAHQWFNYPHPNLHQNPLLLHHILNKPPSFYAQNVIPNNQAQQHLQSPLAQLTTTTTELPTSSLASPQSNNKPDSDHGVRAQNLFGQVGSSSSSGSPMGHNQPGQSALDGHHHLASTSLSIQPTGAVERPAFSATRPFQQPPVNLTLLQMQLDEMRSIAKQSQFSNHNQNVWQHLHQHSAAWPAQEGSEATMPRPHPTPSVAPHWVPHSASMPRPAINMLQQQMGSSSGGPQTMQSGVDKNHQQYGGQSTPAQIIHVNHHHHHVSRPTSLARQNTPAPPIPQQLMTTSSSGLKSQPLASQILIAPGHPQDPYAPSPSLSWGPRNAGQFTAGQARPGQSNPAAFNQSLASIRPDESLNVAASISSGQASADNSQSPTMPMNDEDMSTYVALLSSLNGLSPQSPQSKPTGPGEQQQQMTQLLEQLLADGPNANKSSVAVTEQAAATNQLGSNTLLTGFGKLMSQDQRQLDLLSKNQEARSWAELLRGAKLVGLSDSVQAQIYREHLAPLLGKAGSKDEREQEQNHSDEHRKSMMQLISALQSGSDSTFPSATKQHTTQQTSGFQTTPDSNNQLRTAANSYPFNLATATLHNSPISGSRATTTYGLAMPQSIKLEEARKRAQQLQQQQQEMLRQRARQFAFVEAMRTSLAKLHEATTGDGGQQNASQYVKIKDQTQQSTVAAKDLAATESEPDESLANLGSAAQIHGQQQYRWPTPLRAYASIQQQQQAQLVRQNLFLANQHRIPSVPAMKVASSGPPPVQVYPLRSFWGSRLHHSSGASSGAGPQPRLLWPVYPQQPQQLPPQPPATNYLDLAQMDSNRMVSQQTVPIPLIRLNPIPMGPPAPAPAPLQPPSLSITPNRVMLDRFPLASAPAYLVKLPTLTGGTITASGSLVSAGSRLLRRPGSAIPPAAFISATPLGALRFLSALAPPRMRFSPTSGAAGALIGAQAPPQLSVSSSSGLLQPAPSTLHVGHTSPLAPYGATPQLHLSPVPHFHYHHGAPIMAPSHHHHAAALNPVSPVPLPGPPRFQVYLGGTAPTSLGTDSLEGSQPSPDASGTAVSSSESGADEPISSDGAGEPATNQQQTSQPSPQANKQVILAPNTLAGDHHRDQLQSGAVPASGNALARLQQATASLVELTSLASLLDEMVGGGNDADSSPAMALANAINSLSASQSAATAMSAQATASQATSKRLVPNSSSSSTTTIQQQQQQQQQQQPQSGALFWKNLLMPGLLRQQSSRLLAGGTKLRDLAGLERLLAGTQTIGSPYGPQTARLRVKYIRVPVAVYETTSANGQVTTSLNHVNPNGSQGTLLSAGSDDALLLGAKASGSDPDSSAPDQPGSAGSTSGALATLSSAANPSTAASSNEFLFDEISSESDPQTQYLLQQSAGAPAAEPQFGVLPIVRALNHRPFVQQTRLVPPARPPGVELTTSPLDSSATDIYSLLTASSTPAAATQAFVDPSSSAATSKKKKKKRKRGKKGKGGGGDDDDDEDEEADDEADDDDALSTNDLPIIESLISTIIHGQAPVMSSASQFYPTRLPGSMFEHSAGGDGGAWRPLRGAGHRNRFNLSPEASSNVYTYAPSPIASGSASTIGSHLMSPFKKQRFSLGDVVGAMGAKKLITSLLGRRTKTARESRHKAPIKAGLLAGQQQEHHRVKQMAASEHVTVGTNAVPEHEDEAATTRMPPPKRRHNASGVASPLVRLSFLGHRRRPAASSASILAGKHKALKLTRPTKQGAGPLGASTTGRPAVESEIEATSGANWSTTTRRPRPLVFPAIAAHEFDLGARIKRRTSTTKGPRLDSISPAKAPRPSGKVPATTGLKQSANTPTRQSANATANTAAEARTGDNDSRRPATESSSDDASDRSSSSANKGLTDADLAKRGAATDRPNAAYQIERADNQPITSTVGRTTPVIKLVANRFSYRPIAAAMPLYHMVADHSNKMGAGHNLAPPSVADKLAPASLKGVISSTKAPPSSSQRGQT
jgi:hypothetical protein